MKDEGFLSAAGQRFIAIAAVVLLAGVIAYFAIADEGVSLDFLDDIEFDEPGSGDASSTVSIPEFTGPDFTTPDIPKPSPVDPFGRCLQRAGSDVAAIDRCFKRIGTEE